MSASSAPDTPRSTQPSSSAAGAGLAAVSDVQLQRAMGLLQDQSSTRAWWHALRRRGYGDRSIVAHVTLWLHPSNVAEHARGLRRHQLRRRKQYLDERIVGEAERVARDIAASFVACCAAPSDDTGVFECGDSFSGDFHVGGIWPVFTPIPDLLGTAWPDPSEDWEAYVKRCITQNIKEALEVAGCNFYGDISNHITIKVDPLTGTEAYGFVDHAIAWCNTPSSLHLGGDKKEYKRNADDNALPVLTAKGRDLILSDVDGSNMRSTRSIFLDVGTCVDYAEVTFPDLKEEYAFFYSAAEEQFEGGFLGMVRKMRELIRRADISFHNIPNKLHKPKKVYRYQHWDSPSSRSFSLKVKLPYT